jgi:hypothetical protein
MWKASFLIENGTVQRARICMLHGAAAAELKQPQEPFAFDDI